MAYIDAVLWNLRGYSEIMSCNILGGGVGSPQSDFYQFVLSDVLYYYFQLHFIMSEKDRKKKKLKIIVKYFYSVTKVLFNKLS